jgi:hypothetical protein
MNDLLREAVKPSGGKGGGTKEFAQGSVPEGSDIHRVLRHAGERASKPVPALRVVGKHSGGVKSHDEFYSIKGKARG